MRPRRAGKVAPVPETQGQRVRTEPELQAISATIAARVEALLRKGSSEASNRDLDHLLEETAVSRYSPRDRARLLLFVATGLCAARANRIKAADMAALFESDVNGDMEETAHGRMIERHKTLLSRLVYRGCRLRGEISPCAIALNGGSHANA